MEIRGPKESLDYNLNLKKLKRNIMLNLNLNLDQLEKIILSKFIVDENIKQNISLIRIDNKQPNQKEKELNLYKLKNRNITFCLDELLDALLPENMLDDFRIQNYCILPDVPFIFLKLNKTNPDLVEFDNEKYFLKVPKTYEEKNSINNNLKYVNELNIPNIQSVKGKVFIPNVGYGYLLDYMEGETLDKLNLMNISFNDKILILYRILEVFQALEKYKEFYIDLKAENVLVKKTGKQIDILIINYDIFKADKSNERFPPSLQTMSGEPKFYHFSIGNIAYFLFHSKISPTNLIDNLSKNVEDNNKNNSKLLIIEEFIFNVLKYDNSISINMEDMKLFLVANNAKLFNQKFKEKSLGLVKNENMASMTKSKKIDFKVEKFEPVPQDEDKIVKDPNLNSVIFNTDPTKLIMKKELSNEYQNKNWLNNHICYYYNLKEELTISYIMRLNRTIVIYDIKSYKTVKRINTNHNEEISCLKYYQDKIANIEYLITSSQDKSLKIFSSLSDYECIVTLKNCHFSYGIYSFVLIKDDHGTYIASCNSYGQEKLKIWDFSNGAFIKEIGDNDNNLYLENWKYKDQEYLVACNEYSVKIFNFNDGSQYRVFKGEPVDLHLFATVYEVQDKPILFETSNNGYIRMWNILDNVLDRKIYLKGCKFSNILRWNNQYIIVSSKKVFNIIDIEKKSLSKTVYAHEDWLSSMSKMNIPYIGECLVTSSIDGRIKLWA